MPIQDLDEFDNAVRESAEPDLKRALARVAMEVNARVLAVSSSSTDYMQTVVKALKKMPGHAHHDLRVNCLIDVSHFFYILGQAFSGIEPASDAVEIAAKAEDKSLLRKSLTFLGVMYADTGNISRAIECYAQALDLAQALRDTEAECSVWQNLGVALLYAAQYRDAITTFEHVVRLAGASPALEKARAPALSNIALCCLHLEDFSRGLKAAETCLNESKEPHTAAELVARVLRENNYSRLLLEVSAVEKAGERCQIARRYATRSKSARAEIAASLAEGLYEVHAGRVDVGISRLTSALERARLLRSMLRDALAALVKAYEIIGQPQRALIYLREMIEALRQTQQENALRHVNLHLSQLGQEVLGDTPISARLQRQEAKGLWPPPPKPQPS